MSFPKITPLPLRSVKEPFDHAEAYFELKHDGWRALCLFERGRGVQFISRNGNPLNGFALLAKALAAELSKTSGYCILDGELCVLDDQGRSQFAPLMRRQGHPIFYAFDLLRISPGEDVQHLPLFRRKALLRAMFPASTPHMLLADHVEVQGKALFEQVCRLDGEGIVAKWKDSAYELINGKSPWVKVLNPNYSQKVGRREFFDWARRGRR